MTRSVIEVGRRNNLHSAELVSFKKVNARLRVMLNRPPGDKMDDIEKLSLICTRLLREPALHLDIQTKPIVKKLFGVTQKKIDSRIKIGKLRSVQK